MKIPALQVLAALDEKYPHRSPHALIICKDGSGHIEDIVGNSLGKFSSYARNVTDEERTMILKDAVSG